MATDCLIVIGVILVFQILDIIQLRMIKNKIDDSTIIK